MKNQLRPSVEYNYIPREKPSKPGETHPSTDGEKKLVLQVTDDLINDEPTAKVIAELQGFQDYDLGNLHYISNTGLANMIDLFKSALKKGIEVHFLNASEKIRNKIHAMGMDHILNC
jgi:hypothetical protein